MNICKKEKKIVILLSPVHQNEFSILVGWQEIQLHIQCGFNFCRQSFDVLTFSSVQLGDKILEETKAILQIEADGINFLQFSPTTHAL